MSDLVKRLRIKAGMIEMGEMIAWGSDSALMREAADALGRIPDAGEKVGRPQIREAFMRNGARIEPGRDDLPDYVYESVFELLEMAAPAVQGGPVPHTFYVLYDATGGQKHIKKDIDDGCLAIFEREEDARRAKRRHSGTDYKRVDYYTAPQPVGATLKPGMEQELLSLHKAIKKSGRGGLGMQYWNYAIAVLERYAAPQPAERPPAPSFKLGDSVRKTNGSQWKGRVVGTYSTELTPEGYAVESDTEKGSVQIYPVGALELVGERP